MKNGSEKNSIQLPFTILREQRKANTPRSPLRLIKSTQSMKEKI